MPFVTFMQSMTGRALRVVMGAAMMVAGLGMVGGTGGTILAVIGLVPIVAGLGNLCFFAPLFGLDVWGHSRKA